MNFDLMRSLLIDRALRGELFSNVTSVEAEGKSLEEEQTIPFTIPNHWQWKRVADCVQFNPKVIQDDAVEVSFIPMADVEPGFVDQCSTRQAKPWAKVKKGFSRFQEGDLLVAKITPCFQNRKSCVAKSLINGTGAGSTEFHVMRCVSGVDAKFLLYFFKSEYFIRYGVNHFNGTVGQQRVGAQDIKDCLIPVPSVEEQVRIVAKLEEAFAEIDRAEKAYEELQTLAGVLRGQILQKAMHGELVPQLEGEALPVGVKDVLEHSLDVPKTWKVTKLGDLISIKSGDGLSRKQYRSGPIPVYGGNGVNGYHDCSNVEKNTLVIGRVGYYCGNVQKTREPAWVTDNALIVTFKHDANVDFYLYILNAMKLGSKTSQTAQPVITGKILKPMLVPVPPLEEQARIVAKVEELLKHVDALSAR